MSEDSNGVAGTNLYRYAANNPKNKEAVRTKTDWFKATSEWFSTTGIRAAALVLLGAPIGGAAGGPELRRSIRSTSKARPGCRRGCWKRAMCC